MTVDKAKNPGELSRRGLLAGIIAAVAAPVIIRTPGLLMPIKPVGVEGYPWRIVTAGIDVSRKITGRHAQIILVDDPYFTPEEITAITDRAIEFYLNMAWPRIDNSPRPYWKNRT